MIIRIVHMHFTEAGAKEFLQIFSTHKEAIATFEGCIHVELLKDLHNDHAYTTLSHWKDIESLERYRNSAFFTSVWRTVKTLFAERPQAFSMVRGEWSLNKS